MEEPDIGPRRGGESGTTRDPDFHRIAHSDEAARASRTGAGEGEREGPSPPVVREKSPKYRTHVYPDAGGTKARPETGGVRHDDGGTKGGDGADVSPGQGGGAEGDGPNTAIFEQGGGDGVGNVGVSIAARRPTEAFEGDTLASARDCPPPMGDDEVGSFWREGSKQVYCLEGAVAEGLGTVPPDHDSVEACEPGLDGPLVAERSRKLAVAKGLLACRHRNLNGTHADGGPVLGGETVCGSPPEPAGGEEASGDVPGADESGEKIRCLPAWKWTESEWSILRGSDETLPTISAETYYPFGVTLGKADRKVREARRMTNAPLDLVSLSRVSYDTLLTLPRGDLAAMKRVLEWVTTGKVLEYLATGRGRIRDRMAVR
eukprot:PhM_4_TR13310/c0_g2_i1/m.21031